MAKNAYLEKQAAMRQGYFTAGLQSGRQQILDMVSLVLQDKDLDVCMIEYFDYYSSDAGLTDKNGKKIFEGDLFQKQPFCVVFDDGMFLLDNGCAKVPKYDIYAAEVIGNIHDNPELLGGADNG